MSSAAVTQQAPDDSLFLLNGDISGSVALGNAGPSIISGRGGNLFTGAIFASNTEVPSLQFPEGLTSWKGHVFVGTYNIENPTSSRILVFNAKTGELEQTIGDKPGQELVNSGALLGLSINPTTGNLYANANQAGYVLRIQNPASDNPEISIYSKYPTDTEFPPGPEDMA